MRFILTFIFFLFSSYVYSEEYICAYSYNGETLPNKFERISDNKFIVTNMKGKQITVQILLEEQNYLILGQLANYKFKGKDFNAYKVTYIDKEFNKFQAYSIVEPKYKDIVSNLISGTCSVVY